MSDTIIEKLLRSVEHEDGATVEMMSKHGGAFSVRHCSASFVNPDGPEAAEKMKALVEALEEIASSARGGDPLARDRDEHTLAAIARHADRALRNISGGNDDRG